jgi:hypothetical protein
MIKHIAMITHLAWNHVCLREDHGGEPNLDRFPCIFGIVYAPFSTVFLKNRMEQLSSSEWQHGLRGVDPGHPRILVQLE